VLYEINMNILTVQHFRVSVLRVQPHEFRGLSAEPSQRGNVKRARVYCTLQQRNATESASIQKLALS
jgi:hypothetical protein